MRESSNNEEQNYYGGENFTDPEGSSESDDDQKNLTKDLQKNYISESKQSKNDGKQGL